MNEQNYDVQFTIVFIAAGERGKCYTFLPLSAQCLSVTNIQCICRSINSSQRLEILAHFLLACHMVGFIFMDPMSTSCLSGHLYVDCIYFISHNYIHVMFLICDVHSYYYILVRCSLWCAVHKFIFIIIFL